MERWKPNKKYDHAFVIMGLDRYEHVQVEPQDAIVLVKIVWSEEEAENEVARLSRVNSGKSAVYFWQIGRIVRR